MTNHSSDVPVALSADQRAAALERTIKTLQEIDKIRRALDMPMDQLPLVAQIHDKIIDAMISEGTREEAIKNRERTPLTLGSGTHDNPLRLAPGKKHIVAGRPQRRSFRPEDISIRGDRARWLVHDVLIGNQSQLEAKHGPIPGSEFGPGGVCAHMQLAIVHTAMDLELIVEYVGPDPEGEVFEATVIGTASKI